MIKGLKPKYQHLKTFKEVWNTSIRENKSITELFIFERRKHTTEDLKARVRELYATGNYTYQELADELDMGRTTVFRIIKGA